ncbi:hypothetical protein AVEN_219308-1 [Araneus ventricosus]|uniref:Uncharacterized protein n=1 Tax=Araneus ventricosus TaxID=182803 RepID=A0A4Y2BF20_ARAVE|nr:hypothetical protein AVEN_219308-1 [Araneus ventricosus]
MLPLCRILPGEIDSKPCRHGDDERFIETWVTTVGCYSKGYQMKSKMYTSPHRKLLLSWNRVSQIYPQDAVTMFSCRLSTTSWAHLKLYSEMEAVKLASYHDADSITYESNGRKRSSIG